jgi:hypothetical protein
MMVIELGYREKGVGHRLSNLFPYPFIFRGWEYGSIEGLLQSLKFEDPEAQAELAGLHGYLAFKTGQLGNGWKKTQTLWCQEHSYARMSPEYQQLLTDAYDACLEQNVGFVQAFIDSGNAVLTHSIGKHDSSDTTLTASEYLIQMYRLRAIVQQMMS